MKQKVRIKLEEIAETISEKKHENIDLGLMHGFSGISLFETIYNSSYGDKKSAFSNADFLFKSLDNYLNNNLKYIPQSLGFAGLPGIFWSLSFMQKKKVIDFDSNHFFSEFEQLFDEIIIKEASRKNYDYFYGIIGILLFYKEANLLQKKIHIQKKILDILADQKICISKNQTSWSLLMYDSAVSDYRVNNNEINLGLSHGIPALISCLLMFDKSLNNIIYPLVESSINFILSCQVNNYKKSNTLSQFPYVQNISDSNHVPDFNSRLAWCYGDLGIACVLWNAGVKYNVNSWKQNSHSIILKCSNRRDLRANNVLDAGICHGTSGIAHIFNRFYNYTNDIKIKGAREYWINETLNLAKFPNGTAGYSVCENDIPYKEKETGFLQGVSGIGLVLLSYLDPKSMDWDKSLLISCSNS